MWRYALVLLVLIVRRAVIECYGAEGVMLIVVDVVGDGDDPLSPPRAGGIVNFILGVVTSPPTSAE